MLVNQTSTVGTSGGSATAASTSSTSASTLNYDSFLQLLITEMQNQDPTQPMDPTQTVTQLATFSGVEQAVQTNTLLASLVANSSIAQAASLIGQTVSSADGSTSGVVASVSTSSSGMSATLTNGETVQLTQGVAIS